MYAEMFVTNSSKPTVYLLLLLRGIPPAVDTFRLQSTQQVLSHHATKLSKLFGFTALERTLSEPLLLFRAPQTAVLSTVDCLSLVSPMSQPQWGSPRAEKTFPSQSRKERHKGY